MTDKPYPAGFYTLKIPTFTIVRGFEDNDEIYYSAYEVCKAYQLPYLNATLSQITPYNRRTVIVGEDKQPNIYINENGILELLIASFNHCQVMQNYIGKAISMWNE